MNEKTSMLYFQCNALGFTSGFGGLLHTVSNTWCFQSSIKKLRQQAKADRKNGTLDASVIQVTSICPMSALACLKTAYS